MTDTTRAREGIFNYLTGRAICRTPRPADEAEALLNAFRAESIAQFEAYPGELAMLRGLLGVVRVVAKHGDMNEVRRLLAEHASDEQAAHAEEKDTAASATTSTPDPLAYGPNGYRCGCGKPAHSNLVPCQPDETQGPVRPDSTDALLSHVAANLPAYRMGRVSPALSTLAELLLAKDPAPSDLAAYTVVHKLLAEFTRELSAMLRAAAHPRCDCCLDQVARLDEHAGRLAPADRLRPEAYRLSLIVICDHCGTEHRYTGVVGTDARPGALDLDGARNDLRANGGWSGDDNVDYCPPCTKANAQAAAPALRLPQLAVSCPRCEAPAGRLCTSHSGTRTRNTDTHQDRTAAYRAQEAGR
ncbi:hypothetical protein [Streptomyces sp. NPDC058394]|uniref:zinc finger domain-containing protein n=1 Tax=Streptomyces sp. NPDC058394 TaxID=3346477 RepID=UPI00365CEB4E